ncbi:MAG: APC family permease [Thermoplasmataceae archaeon]
MDNISDQPKQRTRRQKLRRELTFPQLVMIGVVGALGNGALFGTIEMVGFAGPGAILAFVFGAFIYSLVGFTYMELSRVYPEAGGPTRYSIYTHGRWTNIINAFSDLVWYIFIPPIEVVAILYGMDYFFKDAFINALGHPTTIGVLLGAALLLAFVPFNYFGIKRFGNSTLKIGIVKLFFYLSLVIGLIGAVFNYRNLYAYGFLPYGGASVLGIMPFAMYDFGSIRVIPDLAEETKLKEKIPKAIIMTVVVESLIYISIAFAVLMGFHWSTFNISPGNFLGLYSAVADKTNPFFTFAGNTNILYILIAALITGLLTPFVTGYIYLGSGTRVLFAMGRSGFISKKLKKIDLKHAVPIWSLIIFAILGAILVLVTAPDPSIYTFIDDATAAGYLGLVVNPIALMVTRRQGVTRPDQMVRGMKVLAPLSVGLSSLIVFWTGWPSEPYAVLLVAAASVIFGAMGKVKIGAKNAIWYVVYIGYMTVMTLIGTDGFIGPRISFLGYNGPVGTMIPFVWGTVIVLVVSIAVFYPWGVLSGFKEQFSHHEWTDPYIEQRADDQLT